MRISMMLILLFWMATPATVLAQGGAVVREAGEQVMQSLAKYLGKSTTREIATELGEIGGEAAVRQIVQKAMREGGEDVAGQLVKTTGKYGPETIRALKEADQVAPILKSLDELPESSIATALQRLSGEGGKELSQAVSQFGVRALKTELTHPGVGTSLVRNLGEEGIALGEKLTRKEAITLAQHAEDIANLPAAQRSGVLELLHRDAKGMVGFMGKFVEKNPGKTLFAASATTVILAESDRILGGDEVVFDENGIPHLLSRPGLSGRVLEQTERSIVKPLMVYLAPVVALGVAAWLSIKVWFGYRTSKLRLDAKRSAIASKQE